MRKMPQPTSTPLTSTFKLAALLRLKQVVRWFDTALGAESLLQDPQHIPWWKTRRRDTNQLFQYLCRKLYQHRVSRQHCHLVTGWVTYLWSSVSGSTKMFSCLSLTRRNTKESRQGSGTGMTLEYAGFSIMVSENVRANASICQQHQQQHLMLAHSGARERSLWCQSGPHLTCFEHVHCLEVGRHALQCYSLQVGFCVGVVSAWQANMSI